MIILKITYYDLLDSNYSACTYLSSFEYQTPPFNMKQSFSITQLAFVMSWLAACRLLLTFRLLTIELNASNLKKKVHRSI